MTNRTMRSSDSRVWLIPYQAGPAAVPEYLGCAKVGDPKWGLGDAENVECPSGDAHGDFDIVDEIPKARDRATVSVSGLYSRDISRILELIQQGCKFDLQVLIGRCTVPSDYAQGWEKIMIFPSARWTNYAIENFGAMSRDEQAATKENADVSARSLYEVGEVQLVETAKTTVVRELVSIDVCDTAACGDCGDTSTGCKKIFAVMLGVGATPGTLPSVVWSKDGGLTWSATSISTMFSNEAPRDSECVGAYLVIACPTSNSLHWAKTSEILSGLAPSWGETTTGFVAAGAPRALVAADAQHLYIVGAGGYVYVTSTPLVSVSVLDAGVATTQDLNAVHASDGLHAVAVGNNNAVVHTEDGSTWVAVTGPAAGVQLNTVLMLGAKTWLVGTNTGKLYYTVDSGATWTEIVLPIALSAIDHIAASNESVIWLSGRQGASGKLLRSTAGGAGGTWRVLPDTAGSIPANDRINQIAPCATNPNLAWAAGLADDASDGFLVRAQ